MLSGPTMSALQAVVEIRASAAAFSAAPGAERMKPCAIFILNFVVNGGLTLLFSLNFIKCPIKN
ncbi:protein of unknown function [Serratia sp. Tan611]|nr:protein of unknown function [Serratia sp. Tan611]